MAASPGLIRGFDADVAREAPPEYARAARAIMLSTRFRRVAVLPEGGNQGLPPGVYKATVG